MRNHYVANYTKLVDQHFENNLKLGVGNNNGPKIHDDNNAMDLMNESNNVKIHPSIQL